MFIRLTPQKNPLFDLGSKMSISSITDGWTRVNVAHRNAHFSVIYCFFSWACMCDVWAPAQAALHHNTFHTLTVNVSIN